MTSKTSFDKKLTEKEALKELKRCSGTHFDPKIVEVFLELVLSENRNFWVFYSKHLECGLITVEKEKVILLENPRIERIFFFFDELKRGLLLYISYMEYYKGRVNTV